MIGFINSTVSLSGHSTFLKRDDSFLTESSHKAATFAASKDKARRAQLQMTASSSSSSSSSFDEIDFSQLNLSDAGKELEGMIFKPDAKSSEPTTRVRVNYDPACEEAINNQINVEYTASYAYHALFAYFDRDTVALPGFAKYFQDQSVEEREHAEEFMKYQNKRGGKIVLKPIAVPEMKFEKLDGTSDALYAMDLHLQLEKFVFRKLLENHKIAEQAGDPQLTDHIEQYLEHQVEAVKKAADYVAQLKRIGTGHGVWDFDRELAEDAA